MTTKAAKMTRTAGLRAAVAGFVAGRDGKAITDCPYRTDEGREQKVLAYAWTTGFAAGARAAAATARH